MSWMPSGQDVASLWKPLQDVQFVKGSEKGQDKGPEEGLFWETTQTKLKSFESDLENRDPPTRKKMT